MSMAVASDREQLGREIHSQINAYAKREITLGEMSWQIALLLKRQELSEFQLDGYKVSVVYSERVPHPVVVIDATRKPVDHCPACGCDSSFARLLRVARERKNDNADELIVFCHGCGSVYRAWGWKHESP